MRDIRHALRVLLGSPAVTFTALSILALGIGTTAAIFTVTSRVLFRPLPFAAPERLVHFGTLGILELRQYRERSRSFDSVVSYAVVNRNLQDVEAPERLSAVATEPGLFDLLGVPPLAGRTFNSADPPTVAVVSEAFWRRRFAGQTSRRGPDDHAGWHAVHRHRHHARRLPVPVRDPVGRVDSDRAAANRELVSADRRRSRAVEGTRAPRQRSGRASCHRSGYRAVVPIEPRPDRGDDAAGRGRRWTIAARPSDPVRCGRVCPADCLRQRRQSAALAGRRPEA